MSSNFVSNENATTLFTKVKNNFGTQVIEWDDWLNMTKAEKEAIPEAKIINAPGVDDNSGHVNVFKKLWENPTPTANFAAQNITLASDDYDFLLWIFRFATTVPRDISITSKKGDGFTATLSGVGGSGIYNIYRDAVYNSDTSISVYNCTIQFAGQTGSQDNARIVPIAVYGLKKSIDVTAIISDASTDASKCMLSDGVTSVGDVIDKGSVSVTADGVKTYAQLLNELYALIDSSKTSYNTFLVRNSSGNLSVYHPISVFSTACYFTRITVADTKITSDTVNVSSTSSYRRAVTSASSTTFSDVGASAASSGEKLILYY